jgi:outer membrane protein TolC
LAIASELKQTQLRFDAGTVLKSDVLSLEVQMAQMQEAEIRAANGIELSKTSLANLLGLSSYQVFTVAATSPLLTQPKVTASFNNLLELAMSQRPEVKAAPKPRLFYQPRQCHRWRHRRNGFVFRV